MLKRGRQASKRGEKGASSVEKGASSDEKGAQSVERWEGDLKAQEEVLEGHEAHTLRAIRLRGTPTLFRKCVVPGPFRRG